MDAHPNPLAGEDVGHRLREEVRPLLVQQRRSLALLARPLVRLACLLASLDDAFNHPLAHHQFHCVHRRLLRQREDVEGLQWLGVRVLEDLRHSDGGEEAAQLGVDFGVLEAELLGR